MGRAVRPAWRRARGGARRRLLAFAPGIAAAACGARFGLPRWLGPGFGCAAWGAGLAAGLVASQGGGEAAGALRAAGVTLAIVGPLSALRITQHLSNWPGGSRMGGQAVVLTALALQFVTLLASAAHAGR